MDITKSMATMVKFDVSSIRVLSMQYTSQTHAAIALFWEESTNVYEVFTESKLKEIGLHTAMKVIFICGWLLTWFISIN